VFLGTVGIVAGYFMAGLALLTIGMLERSNKRNFADPPR
jgi:hypothetical protein